MMPKDEDQIAFLPAAEYVSQSTIDSPPSEQMELIPQEELDRSADESERLFEVQMYVVLKPSGGQPIKVPLIACESGGSHVFERLQQALASRRNRAILDAILDNPAQESPQEPATPKEEEKATETPKPEEYLAEKRARKPKGEFRASRVSPGEYTPELEEVSLGDAAAEVF